MWIVFVPYRGIYFLYQHRKIYPVHTGMFSSPIGESTFSTEKRNAGNYRSKSFRPLSGNLLSLPKDEDAFVTNMYCVFVPYRGIYFLYLVSVSITRTCNRFRPLSGNLLSLLNNVTVKYAKKEFSSPIGESTFSTTIR